MAFSQFLEVEKSLPFCNKKRIFFFKSVVGRFSVLAQFFEEKINNIENFLITTRGWFQLSSIFA